MTGIIRTAIDHKIVVKPSSMATQTRKILTNVCAALLILLFVYTAAAKLLDYDRTVRAMKGQILGLYIGNILVWLIPTLEVITTVLLLFNRTMRTGFKWAFYLMGFFTTYIMLVLLNVFGRVPCACGGVVNELGWGDHFLFNLFFLGVAIAGLFLTRPIQPSKESFSKISYS
jgi:putative oxidoreductase